LNYRLGKPYNVRQSTVHNHAATWAAFMRVISNKGYIEDSHAERISRNHDNPQYFAYVVKYGWLKRTRVTT
jgi:hypothetical protein